jgi:hypothetical protein
MLEMKINSPQDISARKHERNSDYGNFHHVFNNETAKRYRNEKKEEENEKHGSKGRTRTTASAAAV